MSGTMSGRRRTTMQDVADRAGVSRTTASFVLNGREEMRISAAAAERVRRAARELDYRPNIAARSLSRPLARSIAFLSDEVTTDGYSGGLIAGAIEAAAAGEHALLIGEHAGEAALRDQLVRDFLERQVDGFIVAATYHEIIEVPAVLRRRRPHVLVNCSSHDGASPAVVVDDEHGAGELIGHLVELGHRDGVWIVGELPHDLVGAVDRQRGLLDALWRHGLEPGGSVACKWWPESANEAVAELLAAGERPTALVCINDRVALGAYQALRHAGLDVPVDVSVVSFDDSPMAAWLDPPLTSVAIPHEAIGRRAVELVLEAARDPVVTRLRMPLRVRSSTAPPRSQTSR